MEPPDRTSDPEDEGEGPARLFGVLVGSIGRDFDDVGFVRAADGVFETARGNTTGLDG